MQVSTRFVHLSALALGISAALAFGPAAASGFQIRENSVKALGRASSGTTTAQDDASVAANNPAAMTNLTRITAQVDATVIDLTAEFKGGGTTAFGTPLNGGNGGDPGDPQVVPAMAVVIPLTGGFERLTLGASVNAPFGLKTEYDRDWVGRYNAIESDVRTIDFTLSGALKLTDTLSVGGGLIYQRADVTLSNGIDFGSGLAARGVPGFSPQSADGMVKVSGDDNGIGWIAGVQWRPTAALSLGYAHRSEIAHDLRGDANFTIPGNAAAVFANTGNRAYADGAIFAPLTTPTTDTISGQFDFNDRFSLMADVQRTGWSSLQSVRIFRADASLLANEAFNWKDTWFYSLGGEYTLSDAFTLRAGIAYDESPTNDEARTPRLPDNNRMLYTIGATWNVSDAFSIDAAYMRVQIDSPDIDVVSSSSSRLVGRFSGHADLLGFAAQYRF